MHHPESKYNFISEGIIEELKNMITRNDILSKILNEYRMQPIVTNINIQNFKPGYTMGSSHSHTSMEITNVLTGSGKIIINNKIVKIKKNDCIVIFPNVDHIFYVEQTGHCCFMNIHFEVGEMKSILGDTLKNEFRFLYEVSYNMHGFIKVTGNDTIRNICKRIIDEFRSKNKYSQDLLKIYFLELYIYLSKEIEINTVESHLVLNKHIAKTIEYINKCYSEDISSTALAENAGISYSYLSKLFEQTLNMTINHYKLLAKLDRAKNLLSNTDMTSTEIALMLGFSSSQHFSTRFKTNEGMTPKEYRNFIRQQKNIQNYT